MILTSRTAGKPVAPEVSDQILEQVVLYSAVLAVPARRDCHEPLVRRGEELFRQLNCAACHLPELETGSETTLAELSHQTIRPYTDLLLHDMGALGDGIAQVVAGPREMRTAPLWGLRASGPYLHDSRAATAEEAIRGHDGEGRYPRGRFLRLSPRQRQQLLDFLNSI